MAKTTHNTNKKMGEKYHKKKRGENEKEKENEEYIFQDKKRSRHKGPGGGKHEGSRASFPYPPYFKTADSYFKTRASTIPTPPRGEMP